jgi:RNA polymerase sigma-70 factor (ECF subfamily)
MSDCCSQHDMLRLVEEHAEFLYRLGYRLTGSAHDAEDLAQQALLAAHQHLGQVREPERVRAWLTAVLRNAFRRSLRKRRGTSEVSLEDVGEVCEESPPDLELDPAELQAALGELPDDYRETVVLFFLEQLSYRQVAERLDVPIGTVMSRLSRGKAFLRKRLQPVVNLSDSHL